MDKKLKAEIEAVGRRTKARTAKRQLKEGKVYQGTALKNQDPTLGLDPQRWATSPERLAKNLTARQAFVTAQAGLSVFEFTLNVRQELLGKSLEAIASKVQQQLTTELVLWAGSSGEQHDFHLLTFTIVSETAAAELRDYLAEHGWKIGVRFAVQEVRS